AYRFEPVSPRDTNNWSPRIGLNYRFREWPGAMRVLTGREQLVLRGGYSRSYDLIFNQIFQNVASGFPFSSNVQLRGPNAFPTLQAIRAGTLVLVPTSTSQVRNTVAADFRSPDAEQFLLQFQRELRPDWALT